MHVHWPVDWLVGRLVGLVWENGRMDEQNIHVHMKCQPNRKKCKLMTDMAMVKESHACTAYD